MNINNLNIAEWEKRISLFYETTFCNWSLSITDYGKEMKFELPIDMDPHETHCFLTRVPVQSFY